MDGKWMQKRSESKDQQNIGDVRAEGRTNGQINLAVHGGRNRDNHLRKRGADTHHCHPNEQRWNTQTAT